jgi:hypothetical protein
MHCTIMSLAHVRLISPIGHVYVEPKLEVPTEQVQVEDFTNLDLTQGSPGVSNQCPCLLFEALLYVLLDCALSL